MVEKVERGSDGLLVGVVSGGQRLRAKRIQHSGLSFAISHIKGFLFVKRGLGPYLIFVLFSPQTIFFVQFFSTPKRVNCDKTDFATKQPKLHKREILQQNSIKCDKTSKIVHIMTDFPHISHVETFLHVTEFPHIDHVEKFST